MVVSRIKKLQKLLKRSSLSALFVSSFFNIYYLTGWHPLSQDERAAFVLVTPDEAYLFTDGRYRPTAPAIRADFLVQFVTPEKRLSAYLREVGKNTAMTRPDCRDRPKQQPAALRYPDRPRTVKGTLGSPD